MATAAWVDWCGRDTWEFLATLSWSKASWSVVVLLAALAMLVAQDFNPFIYFIF